jgi:hypothetical protein
MKLFHTGVAAAVLLAATGCFRNVVSEAELEVPQMRSEAAARVVEKALRGLDAPDASGKRQRNVREVETDWVNGRVRVKYNNVELGVCNLRAAVAHAGFSADEFPADEGARAKLPAGARGE